MEHKPLVYRHSVSTRLTHWLGALALLILVMSGFQIFNAAPYLDASDKSLPADSQHHVLAIESRQDPQTHAPVGYVQILGHSITTTGLLGYTDNGDGSQTARAFPAWITLPGYQALADGRRWHLFFGWLLSIAGIWYLAAGVASGKFKKVIIRKDDLPKLLPMQLYYLHLRKTPPPYAEYNPLQKMAYTLVIFVFAPLIILSGLALSPGVDSLLMPITAVFGGRQFARLWHFILTFALIGFTLVHLTMVFTQGAYNNIRSMITGWYRPGEHEVEA